MIKIVMACNYTVFFKRNYIVNSTWYSIFDKPTLSHYMFILDTNERWKHRTNKRLKKYG